jgi:hypothetical protein
MHAHERKEERMSKRLTTPLTGVVFGAMALGGAPGDHPGHMMTAAIAFSEIERMRPDLVEPIGRVLLAHPDPGEGGPSVQEFLDLLARTQKKHLRSRSIRQS